MSTDVFSASVFNFLTVLAFAKSAYALVRPCSNLSRPTTSSSSVTLSPKVASIALNNTVVVTTTQAITLTTKFEHLEGERLRHMLNHRLLRIHL